MLLLSQILYSKWLGNVADVKVQAAQPYRQSSWILRGNLGAHEGAHQSESLPV